MVTPNDPTLVVSSKPCQSALTRKNEYKEEKRKEEEAKIVLAQKMHNEKMGIMERFLDVLSKKAN